jgi:hypothetical protein
MSHSLWDVLGIAPTSDETVIRRAYASVLKRVRPDDDPEGFRQLRAAYEAAMQGALGHSTAQQAQAVHDEEAPRDPTPPTPAPTELSPEQRVAALIHGDDATAAAAVLLGLHGDNTLALAPWMRLSDLLALRLLQDPATAEAQLEQIATEFGWYGPRAQPTTPIVKALCARIDAARWVASVRADAAKWTRFLGNDKAAASAMLLGRGRLGLAALLPPYRELFALLSGLQAHGAWAARRLDEDRQARLRKLVSDATGQRQRRVIALILTAAAFCAAGDLQAAFLCAIVMIRLRLLWLRRFVMLAVPLAAITALATLSDNELAARSVFYCVVALCAGYLGAGIVAMAVAAARGHWRHIGRRIFVAPAIYLVYLVWVKWAWNFVAPIMHSYGLNDEFGPLVPIGALLAFFFVVKHARGGNSGSRPRW